MEFDVKAPQQGPSLEEKLAWVKEMRTKFSPEGMCLENGEIDQDFFKPKQIIIRLTDEPRELWGEAQREALYKGLERFGVGKWKEMIEAYPPLAKYKDVDVRVHAARLMGSQSLARHVGWKGNKAAVDAEREKHHRIARQLNCLKNGVLTEDDSGSVAKYFQEHPEDDPSQAGQQQQQQQQAGRRQ